MGGFRGGAGRCSQGINLITMAGLKFLGFFLNSSVNTFQEDVLYN